MRCSEIPSWLLPVSCRGWRLVFMKSWHWFLFSSCSHRGCQTSCNETTAGQRWKLDLNFQRIGRGQGRGQRCPVNTVKKNIMCNSGRLFFFSQVGGNDRLKVNNTRRRMKSLQSWWGLFAYNETLNRQVISFKNRTTIQTRFYCSRSPVTFISVSSSSPLGVVPWCYRIFLYNVATDQRNTRVQASLTIFLFFLSWGKDSWCSACKIWDLYFENKASMEYNIHNYVFRHV